MRFPTGGVALAAAVLVAGCATSYLVIVDPSDPDRVQAVRNGRRVPRWEPSRPEIARCLARRSAKLEAIGTGPAAVLRAFQASPRGPDYLPLVSGCAFQGLDGESQDNAFVHAMLHEATHLLGSATAYARPNDPVPGSAPTTFGTTDELFDRKRDRYAVYAPGEPGDRIVIPFVRGTPPLWSIRPRLDDPALRLASIYFFDPSKIVLPKGAPTRIRSGTFYLLWDEWNAFIASLELDTLVARRDGCFLAAHRDFYNGVLQWPHFATTYFDEWHRAEPARAQAFVTDGSFRAGLGAMVARTERAIEAAAKYSCLSQGTGDLARLEVLSAVARKKLREIAGP